jgi:hypothetical protein
MRLSAVVLGWAVTILAPNSAAAQGLAASITLNGQTHPLAPPVAILDAATQKVSILFPASVLPSAVEAASRLAGAWDLSKAGPAVLLEFDFTPQSTSGLAEQMRACRITATGFAAPLRIAGTAADCHVRSVGGMVRPGGLLIGLVQGQGPSYALNLPFTAAFYDVGRADPPAPARAPGAGAAAAATTGVPPGTVSGSGTYTGQTLMFSDGLAWWDASNRTVKVMFFDHPPRPGILEEARTGAIGEGAPTMDLYLRFQAGAAPGLASVDYCFVNLTFPKGGPMGANTTAAGCGLTSLVADPRAGGTISAVLKGQARGPVADYTWNVRFNLPIAK